MAVLPIGIGSAAGGGGYQIERSLRFNSADSAYLNRTFVGTPNTYTLSMWIKRGSSFGSQMFIVGSRAGSSTDGTIQFNTSNQITVVLANTYVITTTAVYRDPAAWYHLVLSVTASGTAYLYINNVQVGSVAVGATCWLFNSTNTNTIGRYGSSASLYYDGYMTEVNFIDGQALTPSSFGETDTNTGVWKPKAFSGTYGTNGFYLKFADNSGTTSTTLGKDTSGNGNNWTPNNFSVTAGVGNDSLVDSPTSYGTDTGVGGEVRGNYATLSPVSSSSLMTLANGNLDVTSGTTAANGNAYSTISPLTGKFYAEVRVNTGSNADMIGVCPNTLSNSSGRFDTLAGGIGYYYDGQKYVAGVVSNYGSSYTTNDVIGIALDMDAQTVTFYKNNVSQGTISSSMTANVGYYFVSSDASSGNGINHTWNFGQRAFAYTAPSGFKALCTQNLPTPTIGATSTTQANDYFDVTTYSGSASSQSITNSGSMQPDFVWIKSRNTTDSHNLTDAVRGTNKNLFSNSTAAEDTVARLTSFNSNGFTLAGGYGNTNNAGQTYVAWQWRASNTTAVTNTAGTITSTVSANTTAGFSVVTYTGTGANATVGHGLGVAPSMIIAKRRNGIADWMVAHSGVNSGTNPFNYYMLLNTTAAQTADSTAWNNTAPTSTVFSLGSGGNVNSNGATNVAYCFAPVAGYSAFGSYTGNNSNDGPFIFTNFRPAFVLIKATNTTQWWTLLDSKRDTYNVSTLGISPNSSDAESTFNTNRGPHNIDFTSNGFKIRTSSSGINGTNTFIYACFAESPFKYSLAR